MLHFSYSYILQIWKVSKPPQKRASFKLINSIPAKKFPKQLTSIKMMQEFTSKSTKKSEVSTHYNQNKIQMEKSRPPFQASTILHRCGKTNPLPSNLNACSHVQIHITDTWHTVLLNLQIYRQCNFSNTHNKKIIYYLQFMHIKKFISVNLTYNLAQPKHCRLQLV